MMTEIKQLIIILFFSIPTCLVAQEKLTIGVLPFTSVHGANANYVQSLSEAVNSAFVKTKRFTVVDRSKMESLAKERDYQMGYDFANSDIVKQGNAIGIEYLIAGHVNVADCSQYRNSKGVISWQCKLSITLKLISLETAEITATETINPTGGNSWAGAFGYGPKTEAEAFGKAINDINPLVDRFVHAQFPIKFLVAEVTEEKGGAASKVLIMGGSEYGLEKKDKLIVIELITEEYGGIKAKREKPIADLKVESVQGPHFSECKVTGGGEAIIERIEAGAQLFCKTQ